MYRAHHSEQTGDPDPGDRPFALPPQLDADAFWSSYAGDLEYAYDMLHLFLENIDADVQAFRQAFQAEDWEELARLAHKMKPSFQMVGLTELSQLLEKTEIRIKTNLDAEQITSWRAEFEVKYPAHFQAVASVYHAVKTQMNNA